MILIDSRVIKMCRVMLFFLFTTTVFSDILPSRPSGPVADFAGIIDSDTRIKVSSAARNLWVEWRTGLIIVTVVRTGDMSVGKYAEALFTRWGLRNSDTREVVMIMICQIPSDVAIIHSSSISGEVQRNLTQFSGCADIRSGDFSTGLLVLTAELMRAVKGGVLTGGENISYRQNTEQQFAPQFLLILLLAIGAVTIVAWVRIRRYFAGRFFPDTACREQFHCLYSHGLFLSDNDRCDTI